MLQEWAEQDRVAGATLYLEPGSVVGQLAGTFAVLTQPSLIVFGLLWTL